jgi:hypothetical protein
MPWTNETAITQWDTATTRESLAATATDGDFVKRHLVNPVLLRLLGDVRGRRYLDEYEIDGPTGTDFHRPISAYLNELASLGCHLRELAEPGLDPSAVDPETPALDGYVHLPNFLIVGAER